MVYQVTQKLSHKGITFLPGKLIKLTEEEFNKYKGKVVISKKYTKELKITKWVK